MQQAYQHLKLETADGVARVTINRPEVHNAFNALLVAELHRAFQTIANGDDGEVRAVVLSGEGKSFCAGADVYWMRESLHFTEEENVQDALRMANMFDTIDRCPIPTICRIHGAALGGGVGLAAVCDIVVAAEGSVFAFSEAKLGIAPSVISPYVIRKIGQSHARALFLTAERFGAARALQIGLVHAVTSWDALDGEIDRILAEIKTSAPLAVSRAKSLIATVPSLAAGDATQYTAETIAALRTGPEGQEGLRAFLERRKAAWV